MLAQALESSAAHYCIIALTLLDLAVVATELILSSIYACHEHVPHAVHTAEDALRWTSVSILCLFSAELLTRLAVFGLAYFTGSMCAWSQQEFGCLCGLPPCLALACVVPLQRVWLG
jgi:hypothetical protein